MIESAPNKSIPLPILLLTCVVAVVATLIHAQEPSSGTPPLNERQRSGRILFMQNCAFCHLPYRTEDKTGKAMASIGPNLKGLLQRDNPLPDAAVRTLIAKGVPRKMPAFQYDLNPKEIDLVIAYLKVD